MRPTTAAVHLFVQACELNKIKYGEEEFQGSAVHPDDGLAWILVSFPLEDYMVDLIPHTDTYRIKKRF